MNKRLVVGFLLAIFIALLFWSSSLLQNEFWRIVEFFNILVERNALLAIGLFVISATLGALISPLTNVPLVPFAVAIWGPTFTTLLLLIGWLMGGIVAYLIGRLVGERIVPYLVYRKKFETWSQQVNEQATFSTALLLRLVLPAELGYAFGVVRYPLGAYSAITVLSELPYAIASAYASEAVLLGNALRFLGFSGILLMAILIALGINHRNNKKKLHHPA